MKGFAEKKENISLLLAKIHGNQTSSSSKFFIVPNNMKTLETQNMRNHFHSFSFTIRIEILKL